MALQEKRVCKRGGHVLAGTAKQAVNKAASRALPKQAPQKAKQIPQKAKQIPQKAKQLPQKAKQVSRQAGRAAQQAAPGGFKEALKDQDTLANVGGAVLVGLGVLVASSATLGCKPSILPIKAPGVHCEVCAAHSQT